MQVIAVFGAFAFGLLIGWYVYYVNRYRKGDVQFSDLTTLVGVLGGAAITGLFPRAGDGGALFGAYGIGLATGFFVYLGFLLGLVKISPNFNSDWFLDGRRRRLPSEFEIPGDQTPTFRPADASSGSTAEAAAAAAAAATAAVLRRDAPPQAEVVAGGQAVIAACEGAFDDSSDDCSKFAKAVAAQFGVPLTGQADDIVDQIAGLGWTVVVDGVKARAAAEAGMLVLAGLKGADYGQVRPGGHVAVVVAGPLAHNKYPSGYWGARDGGPGRNRTLNWAWSVADRDGVHYAAHSV